MSTFVVGDVQGCLTGLQKLLQAMSFDPNRDRLWLAGDAVNRGPHSLEVLRFITELPACQMVLGNHDLHALALHFDCWPEGKKHTMDALMQAPDAKQLLHWLRAQPLLLEDTTTNTILTHAGIYPHWSLEKAKEYAGEVEALLRSADPRSSLLAHMYGNTPDRWHEDLVGPDRHRFIINAFTRMRYVSKEGALDFTCTDPPPAQDTNLIPWYQDSHPSWQGTTLLFGHWASLQAKPIAPSIIPLDGGYVWGHNMVGYELESGQMWRVQAT